MSFFFLSSWLLHICVRSDTFPKVDNAQCVRIHLLAVNYLHFHQQQCCCCGWCCVASFFCFVSASHFLLSLDLSCIWFGHFVQKSILLLLLMNDKVLCTELQCCAQNHRPANNNNDAWWMCILWAVSVRRIDRKNCGEKDEQWKKIGIILTGIEKICNNSDYNKNINIKVVSEMGGEGSGKGMHERQRRAVVNHAKGKPNRRMNLTLL